MIIIFNWKMECKLISPMGEEITWEVLNEVTYITCHAPPIDIIIKEREEK